MTKNTPAMGWNTWNTFGSDINEELILQSAQKMVDSGLKDAGYEYIVIDDCWSLKERDKDGRLVADPEKFPHGMKYVADKVHSLGLKFGMYSCAGAITCGGYPASYNHEFIDAETFASWGVDYLKYDFCFRNYLLPAHILYKRMGLALLNCGRDILFSACSWGSEDTYAWIKETGANSFRSTGDIAESWESIKTLAQSQMKLTEYNGVGCYNDMDMLVVGMNGKGYVTQGGCSFDEYFAHFAIWCFMSSTLMIGCDIRTMDENAKKILTNPDLIRINQDSKGTQPFFVHQRLERNKKLSLEDHFYYDKYKLETPIMARYLDDGKIAILACNFTEGSTSRWNSMLLTDELGLPQDKKLRMRNVYTQEITETKNGMVAFHMPPHSAQVFICDVIDA